MVEQGRNEYREPRFVPEIEGGGGVHCNESPVRIRKREFLIKSDNCSDTPRRDFPFRTPRWVVNSSYFVFVTSFRVACGECSVLE